jgi:DNA-binding transcriptional LysR family regulator
MLALCEQGLDSALETAEPDQPAGVAVAGVEEGEIAPQGEYYLYYPSRRQPSAAFTLVVDALRHRGAG